MTGVLGCPGRYTVELRSRGGGQRVATLTSVTSVRWTRTLTSTSEAAVTVAPRSRACARAVAQASAWAHELVVWRDSERVWEGPVTDYQENGEAVTVTAKDLTAWLPSRLVHDGYDTTVEPQDVALLALRMLGDAYGPDDPGAARYLRHHPTGIRVARSVGAELVKASDDLSELVKLGLEWTVAGRRIHLFGGGSYPLGQLAPLTPDHFTGSPGIVRAGAGVVTRQIVQGGGVRGEAGGRSAVFGLLEALDTQSSVATQWDADVAAAAALYTPSLMLAGNTDVALTGRAPVSVAELVPGVASVVTARGVASVVTALCVLTKVSAQWDPSGEKIGAAFVGLDDTGTGQ